MALHGHAWRGNAVRKPLQFSASPSTGPIIHKSEIHNSNAGFELQILKIAIW